MKKILLVVGLLLFGLAGLMLAITDKQAPAPLRTSFEYPQARVLAPFRLTDQHGQVFDNARLMGKWSLFFLGYTSCPDLCPTTLGKLAAAYPELSALAPFQVVFISVDPQRDTQAKLLDYINFFNPEFIAATAGHEQLFPLSRSLGFVYALVGDGDDYQIDHSASMVLVSPAGERVAVIKPSASPGQAPQIRNQDLIADLGQIIRRHRD
ncbi:SCO family protein [Shewanella sp. AS16]|uniref:SCO family protein n=1 Tax=Shewanella sp. AS16 TaxID=2907625 RepID=UPI001F2F106E|nr:SCO family protein [Shewanella sp. AS16]MCE9686104.1 SCO family protein [Shewanella sp. AS16]